MPQRVAVLDVEGALGTDGQAAKTLMHVPEQNPLEFYRAKVLYLPVTTCRQMNCAASVTLTSLMK